MLTAVKANREEKISDDKKEEYLAAGYDIIDENGKRTQAPSKKVSYAEYEKLEKECRSLKEKLKAAKKELEELKKAGA